MNGIIGLFIGSLIAGAIEDENKNRVATTTFEDVSNSLESSRQKGKERESEKMQPIFKELEVIAEQSSELNQGLKTQKQDIEELKKHINN